MDKHSETFKNKKLRILIIEDSEDDAILLKRELKEAYEFTSERVDNAKTLQEALNKDWDVVLSDYQMPGFNALNALKIIHQSGKDIPFIIISGTIGEDVAVEAMKAGAHDYLMKGNLTRLVPVIDREIKDAEVRSERNKGTEALITAALEWQHTFDAIGDMVAIIDNKMVIQRANKAMLEGFKGQKVIGEKCFQLIHGTNSAPEDCKTCLALENNQSVNFEIVHDLPDGKKYFSVSVFPFGNTTNGTKQFVHVLRDITEQKHHEEEQRQGEKLQALGQLAGGVAHDFNNNLTAIMGYTSLIETMVDDERLLNHLQIIQTAAKRSAELTSQLLAFARKGKYRNQPVDLHKVINEIITLLSRSIDKRIEIKCEFNATTPTTFGDSGQISNAILNVAINARDAMKDLSGKLTFTTKTASSSTLAKLKQTFNLLDKPYIQIEISDTGKGIKKENFKHIFEPFFTTKPMTEGTGLGLSAAYGTLLNHDGAITVNSKEGETTFTLFFPASESVEIVDNNNPPKELAYGSGKVLVIDDEKYITEVASGMLEILGYSPVVCLGGKTAIELYKKEWKEIDLIILDLIMPDLSGEDTFVELLKINTKAKILISTGFSKVETINKLNEMGAIGSIPKPYILNTFSQAVKKALDS